MGVLPMVVSLRERTTSAFTARGYRLICRFGRVALHLRKFA